MNQNYMKVLGPQELDNCDTFLRNPHTVGTGIPGQEINDLHIWRPLCASAQGWECPKCGSVYSPTTPMCFKCGNSGAPASPTSGVL